MAKVFPMHDLWPRPNGKKTKESGLQIKDKEVVNMQ
jgi:hypothetical protein